MTFTHITAVINKSGYISTFGGIDDRFLIDSEHVAASNASFLISVLSHVGNDLKRKKRLLVSLFLLRRTWQENLCISYLSDDVTHILDHQFFSCYRFHSKQAPLMDATWTETSPFLTELLFGDSRRKKTLAPSLGRLFSHSWTETATKYATLNNKRT